MKGKTIVLVLAFALALFISGCASTRYISDARGYLEKAKAAGAVEKSPYEYYLAEEYLSYAEHENEEGDRKQAEIFAREAIDHAKKALEESGGGVK
ncbi:MAG: DUF4398 domain-containing protein [Deltaproteobacteria bacterium]|nr:MAG: DUF4398 domain-containing protein [Deltaproteobacteria bacterium]